QGDLRLRHRRLDRRTGRRPGYRPHRTGAWRGPRGRPRRAGPGRRRQAGGSRTLMARRLSELVKRELAQDPEITGVTADSRKVKPGALFAALPGTRADGRAFARQALAQGAA